MMKNDLMLLDQKALRAAFVLNDELLVSDAAWGYNGDKDDFDRLFAECRKIAADELPDEADIEQICEMFWDIQLEVMNGDREVDWYLY